MDPNQNNNNSSFDPNAGPAVLASTTPVPPASDSFAPQPPLANDSDNTGPMSATSPAPTAPSFDAPTAPAWGSAPMVPGSSADFSAPVTPSAPAAEPSTWSATSPAMQNNPLSNPASSGAPSMEPVPTFIPPAPVTPAVDPASQAPTWPFASSPPSPAVQTPDSGVPFFAGNSTVEPVPSEVVPTDLSHLVGGNTLEPVTPMNIPAPVMETPVSQPANGSKNGEQAVAATATPSGGFPKLILAIGVLILLAVAAASAYFILGVGKAQPEEESIPAEQQPLTTPPRSVLPPTATPQPTLPATGSASLGNLQGATPTASPSGTSAIDLLRQQQGR